MVGRILLGRLERLRKLLHRQFALLVLLRFDLPVLDQLPHAESARAEDDEEDQRSHEGRTAGGLGGGGMVLVQLCVTDHHAPVFRGLVAEAGLGVVRRQRHVADGAVDMLGDGRERKASAGDAFEVGGDGRPVGVAHLRIARHHLAQQERERGGHGVVELVGVVQMARELALQNGVAGLAVERNLPGHHVVHRGAQRIDVGPAVRRRRAADEFRRRVVGRAVQFLLLAGGGFALEHEGEAQVGHLHGAVLVDEQVVGFDVEVDEAGLLPRVVEGLCHVQADRHHVLRLQRAAAFDPVAHGIAVDELHRDEGGAPVLTGLVHLHDAGVLELRGGLRLLFETHDVLRVVRHMAGQHLDGDHAPQGKLTGLEDGASAPLAQLFEQLKTCDDRI